MLGIAALLASGAGDLSILFGALIANGFTRFVSSGPVRRAARRGASRAGGDDELGRDGHRRRGGVPRRRLHAGVRDRCSAPTTRVLRQSFSSSCFRCRSPCCCRCGSPATYSGRTRARGPFTGRWPTPSRPDGCTAPARCSPSGPSRPRSAGWPPTGWCSASTPCWCSSWCATATPRASSVSAPRRCSSSSAESGRSSPTCSPRARWADGAATAPPTARCFWRRSSSSAASVCRCR